MGASIVDIQNMGDALRNTGYKNIESAVAEIIDNSVEANAKNIFLILREGIATSGRKVVTEIGFLDNGDGMSLNVLGSCLGIGASTRKARKGMGRFGVGLPQASLYACPEIEVYSWQTGVENAHKVYLDINKIKDGEQKEIEDPALTQIPDPYASYLHYQTLSEKYDFSKSGTLVIWKKCDRISPKTRGPLTERLEFSLGQKFRYFIHDGVSKIKIVCDENPDVAVDVAPNDPLFLMEDNCVLCHQDDPKKVFKPGEANGIEAPFELYTAKGDATGEVQIPIKYIDKNGNKAESSVLVRFSIVKNKFYDETAFPKGINPGNYALGKHAAKMEGISVVRARREIDFRRFDYYNVVNEPQHRWWGCEIIFTPELDEAFGVANNKQYVELKKVDVEDLDPDEVDIPPIWDQLADTIISTIKAMYAQNKETRNNTRTFDDTQSPSTDMKQAEYFGYSGDRVKGLIFCSRIDEAKELSKKFNDKGWRTLVLSGSDSEEARAAAIERLAGEESEDALDYIISVDIFSEGVDVPEINQVIMLRPTESPIVFIQQLGRGLRKAENKEYVVVLDFIGNYRNNFMIPIALSGDRSYNKDNIRRYVTEGGRVIPGASTIHFDEISRKRIFQAIDNANFSDIKLIRENYTNLKNKLGHIPALADFDKYGEMDVLRIFDNNSLGSYYKFLVKYEKEYTIRLSEDEEKAIEFISKKLASGKRIHELELLKRTLQYHHGIIGRLRKHLSEKYQCEMDEHCTENVVNMMTNEFSMSAAKKTYAQCVFLKKEQDDYGISDVYGKMLQNPEFCAILEELVDFGISRYKVNYSYHYQDTNLVLYQKYTYEDACRLLNWERNEVPLNIGGYKYDKKTKTFPIFINYDKQDDISDTTKYEDHFVAENRLIAISKSGRSMDSEDVQNFLKATERGIDVQLFVRKNKDDKISKEFYYLGRVIATGNAKQFVIPNTDKTAVEIEWELETPVREDIYQYIVNE